jgi:hypothetical protein
MKARSILIAVVLAAALTAPPAHAWPARPIATVARTTDLRGIAGLPGGRTAVLLETHALARGRPDGLELRTGAGRVVVARSPSGFQQTALGHDAAGRLTVMWVTGSDRTGGMRVRVWSDGRTTPLSASVLFASLAVAPDGGAVVAWSARNHDFAVMRRPGAQAFGAPQDLTPAGNLGGPFVAVARGGGAVVASGALVTRADPATGVFGPPQTMAPAAADGSPSVAAEAVALTDAGRAVVTLRVGASSVIQLVDWPAAASAPSVPVTLSTQSPNFPPRPAGAANGDRVTIVYAEGPLPEISGRIRCPTRLPPRQLGVAVLDPAGAVTASALGPVDVGDFTLAPVGPAVRVFLRAPGGVRATRLDAQARPLGTSAITTDRRRCVLSFAADETAAGPIAAWSEPVRGGRSRVMLAQP